MLGIVPIAILLRQHYGSPYEIDIQKQIIEAFKVFDQNETGVTELKNVGIIVRALGRVPRNAEIKHFMEEVEDTDSKGFVKLSALLPALKDILLQDKWKPASKEQLLRAFEFFDSERKGFINPSYMRKIMMESGDKFDKEEVEEFLKTVVTLNEDKIEYANCCEKLVISGAIDIFGIKRMILSKIKDE